MRFPQSLKAKLLLVIVALGLLITTCSFYAYSVAKRKIVIEATYLRSPSGLFAEVGFPPDALHFPPLQLTDCTLDVSLFQWTDEGWKPANHILSYGWDAKKGARARLSVPDARWKIEFRAAPHRQLKIGAIIIPLSIKTNVFAVAEFPPQRELEAALR